MAATTQLQTVQPPLKATSPFNLMDVPDMISPSLSLNRDLLSQSNVEKALDLSSNQDNIPSSMSKGLTIPLHSDCSDDPLLLARFSTLLDRSLDKISTRIVSDIKSEFQALGTRMNTLENTLDNNIAKTDRNTNCIGNIQAKLDEALNKIDELENRSRRHNFRVRGIPESFIDSDAVIKELISYLIPDIPAHRLELDRAHRALTGPRSDGLPRDILVKPHYYEVKEKVMATAREITDLHLRDHPIQIFADISPDTVQKRRAMKPLL